MKSLGNEPHNTHYWDAKRQPFAKGPGNAKTSRTPNHGKKNVIMKFPFADERASVERIVRQDCAQPEYLHNIPKPPTSNIVFSLEIDDFSFKNSRFNNQPC